MKWIVDPIESVIVPEGDDGCWFVCDCRKGFSCSCHKSRTDKKKKKKKKDPKNPKNREIRREVSAVE